MRVDAHQHFWEYNSTDYVWMSDRMDSLRRNFLPEDLRPLIEELRFDGSVAVQARQNRAETEFLLGLARRYRAVMAVVGWVDLCDPSVAEDLATFAESSPKFVGVRHVVHDEPDDDFMLQADFRHGIAQLAQFSLTYDLLIFPRHIKRAVRLVDDFPDQPFVVDHIAKPPIRERGISPWREHLRELARRPNVYCKLSGMVTEADWNSWEPADFRPYLDVVIDAFGTDRVMIGSDWPVCTVAGSYESVIGIVVDYLERELPGAVDSILGENCCRFYGIPYDERT